jgi:hypothetical protein
VGNWALLVGGIKPLDAASTASAKPSRMSFVSLHVFNRCIKNKEQLEVTQSSHAMAARMHQHASTRSGPA